MNSLVDVQIGEFLQIIMCRSLTLDDLFIVEQDGPGTSWLVDG